MVSLMNCSTARTAFAVEVPAGRGASDAVLGAQAQQTNPTATIPLRPRRIGSSSFSFSALLRQVQVVALEENPAREG
jgi:hypothetical protein